MTIMKLTARTPKTVTAFMGTTIACDALQQIKGWLLSIVSGGQSISELGQANLPPVAGYFGRNGRPSSRIPRIDLVDSGLSPALAGGTLRRSRPGRGPHPYCAS